MTNKRKHCKTKWTSNRSRNFGKEEPETDIQVVRKCLEKFFCLVAARAVISPMLNTKTKKSCEFVQLDDVGDFWSVKKVNRRN